jgi:cytochrome o ubiquinol oxidase subunit 1
MGAVRRLDDYDPSFGWQSLFIVAGIGVMIIGLGVVTQITQIGYSWLKRKQLKVNSDPWDGRTLEWATPTPVPDYSFAKLPIVSDRDAWWEMKHAKTKVPTKYEDIEIPKNTGYGVYIGLLSTIVAFSIIWHIWWLVIVSGVALVVVAISSTLREKTERVITAADIIAIEGKRQRSVL